jgi:hypothetical protein
MERSIGDVLREYADNVLHADFIDHALRLLENTPDYWRYDMAFRSDWLREQEAIINAYLPVFSEEAGVQLRPLKLIEDSARNTIIEITQPPELATVEDSTMPDPPR